MESKEFLESLERLKATLEDVKSAKEQVDQTVNAYSALHADLTDYTEKMNTVAGGLETVIDGLAEQKHNIIKDYSDTIESLKATCSGLVDAQRAALEAVSGLFQTTCGNSNKSFSDKLDQSATDFGGKIDAEIGKLKTAYDDELSKLSGAIDTFGASCDDALSSISAKSDQATDNFKEKVGAAVADFKAVNAAEISKLETQITKLEQQVLQLDIIEAAMKKSTELVRELKQNLDQLGENLNNSQTEQNDILAHLSSDLKESQDSQDKVLGSISESIVGQGEKLGQQAEVLTTISQGVQSNGQTASSINDAVGQIPVSLKVESDKVARIVSKGNNDIMKKMDSIESRNQSLEKRIKNMQAAIFVIIFVLIVVVLFRFVK